MPSEWQKSQIKCKLIFENMSVCCTNSKMKVHTRIENNILLNLINNHLFVSQDRYFDENELNVSKLLKK